MSLTFRARWAHSLWLWYQSIGVSSEQTQRENGSSDKIWVGWAGRSEGLAGPKCSVPLPWHASLRLLTSTSPRFLFPNLVPCTQAAPTVATDHVPGKLSTQQPRCRCRPLSTLPVMDRLQRNRAKARLCTVNPSVNTQGAWYGTKGQTPYLCTHWGMTTSKWYRYVLDGFLRYSRRNP
jgi:hypothetical protein